MGFLFFHGFFVFPNFLTTTRDFKQFQRGERGKHYAFLYYIFVHNFLLCNLLYFLYYFLYITFLLRNFIDFIPQHYVVVSAHENQSNPQIATEDPTNPQATTEDPTNPQATTEDQTNPRATIEDQY